MFSNSLRLGRETAVCTYVSEAERGLRNVSYRNLNKLADALELPLTELIAAAKRLEGT
jgi:transcriptional regulator with XRE-family HTH domain